MEQYRNHINCISKPGILNYSIGSYNCHNPCQAKKYDLDDVTTFLEWLSGNMGVVAEIAQDIATISSAKDAKEADTNS